MFGKFSTAYKVTMGFEYVVKKQGKQKICFGSSCPRDTSKKGMSSFMKYYTLEDNPDVSPNSYNALASFKAIKAKPCPQSISKKGYSGIARYWVPVSHTEDTPSPAHYSTYTFPVQVKQLKFPFASSSKRKTSLVNNNPGPGMYFDKGRRNIQFEHSFGGRVKMKLGVDLKCCSHNVDICKMCGKKPIGDYWHCDNKIFLCRPCMERKHQERTSYKDDVTRQFHKVRDCSDIHAHGGTTAKTWLMHPAKVAQWMRKEAYLSAYMAD